MAKAVTVFDWEQHTKEACEHIRYMVTSDNDLFVLDMVKREGVELSKAYGVRMILCPYEGTFYEINPDGTDGITLEGDRFRVNEV